MIRERNASTLESWLKEAIESGVPELLTFAAGVKRDQAAIQAALTYEWSRGQVEGQVHRLKLLKRQSYGRARIWFVTPSCPYAVYLSLARKMAQTPFSFSINTQGPRWIRVHETGSP